MMLIDTNIWIEFFRQNPEYTDDIISLLHDRQVITIEPIFSELLYGVKSKKDKEKVQDYWKILPKVDFANQTLIKAAIYANENKYYNRGIGLIDAVIIKAVIDNDLILWTLDKKITNMLEVKYLYKRT